MQGLWQEAEAIEKKSKGLLKAEARIKSIDKIDTRAKEMEVAQSHLNLEANADAFGDRNEQ